MKIAVDFDGTIVEHRYPDIGKEMLFAFDTLKALQKQKHQLILWTFRSGKELEEAVEYCRKNGVEFYAVNKSYPEEQFDEQTTSRKIQADIFIDDRNVGGFPGWGRIYQMLNPHENPHLEEELRELTGKKSFFRRLFGSLILLLAVSVFYGCGNNNNVSSKRIKADAEVLKLTTLALPGSNMTVRSGDSIPVVLSVPDTLIVDSIQLFTGGRQQPTLLNTLTGLIPTAGFNPGRLGVRMKVFLASGHSETHSRQVTVLSDIIPQEYGYRVVRIYPHDVKAYTQGLQYSDGFLYEGTGQYSQSSLRKVALESGEPVKIRNLSGELFGEGITVFRDKIYQLTYRSQVGFVYDKNSFEELQKIYYQNKEGWGLTHNGSELIMSDGSNILYFLDPELFTVNRQIEVYNHTGIVDALNELEYINGKIWANRYYTDEIVMIDPASGKVEGRINLKGILPASDRKSTTDVLNGIAWDSREERIFVTGKYWPKLFEIQVYGK
ncbi:MAG: glutaminyl-peptide cyclotransferase [Bacteroidales bacterium]|nr:glutaminyl-peptide cyclotransferase [Bacteroidales bacterium]MBN2699420.1 glutaminyl-peptide cyclotransferase [Bacteroidales bacterium]